MNRKKFVAYFKKVYHFLIVDSSIKSLCTLFLDSCRSLVLLVFGKYIPIADISLLNLMLFAKMYNKEIPKYSGRGLLFQSGYDNSALRSIKAHDAFTDSMSRSSTLFVNIAGNRPSAIRSLECRIDFYLEIIKRSLSKSNFTGFIFLEPPYLSEYETRILLSRVHKFFSQIGVKAPRVEVLRTNNVDYIYNKISNSSYFVGRVGCDATLALMSGIPSTIFYEDETDDPYVIGQKARKFSSSSETNFYLNYLKVDPYLSHAFDAEKALELGYDINAICEHMAKNGA